ncbi:DHHA1 domain-containing protein [Virgibacillus sp. M23]|uniref:DHH family phosphoesterase n=1 Tax=Virgibacillus sp. M23 TaxID=3079030 RepID=UPI002A912C8E|nr:DHHA1 domain-containing protein [Virgibacillus sp. M23]MDY7043715.1 DHHA1 domain-containing protein [Virgibacillus sp. M23]
MKNELGKIANIVRHPNMKKKTKLFTHNDLDGIGCEIIGRLAFEDIDVTIVKNPQDATQKVKEYIESREFVYYEHTYITDISISNELASIIDNYEVKLENKELSNYFTLLDHHKTAEYLNKYKWCNVQEFSLLGKASGTDMFYSHLDKQGLFDGKRYVDVLDIFVEKVRRYDTWEWKTKYDDQESLKLNDLFFLLGREDFVQSIIGKIVHARILSFSDGSWHQMFTASDEAVLHVDDKKKQAYIESKKKELFEMPLLGYNAGVVFAEQYISELGNSLAECYEDEVDFIVIIDMGRNRISYRGIKDIDLGNDVAKVFGGGGHAKASGSGFDKSIQQELFNKIFNTKARKGVLLNKIIDKITKK